MGAETVPFWSRFSNDITAVPMKTSVLTSQMWVNHQEDMIKV